MADEGFEAFHVPRQSRRDQFRVVNLLTNPPQPQLSLFTPSTMPTPQPPLSPHFSDHDHRVSFEGGEFRSSVPLGPFTGYASILKRSRFLKPAQQLLQDFCGSDRSDSNLALLNCFIGRGRDQISGVSDRVELQFKNSRLTIMLEEVYKRYKLYCQQMESVVASFETIDGLGNAAPYISFAIKAILKHFGCLKNAILDKLQSKGKSSVGDFSHVKDGIRGVSGVSRRGFHSQNPSHENLTNNFHLSEIRSQRGLPENAVAVMRTWLFEHFLHPYPSDSEKQMLAQQTGLSRTQVSNWFINSRVRLWKPMVEEIHSLETQQAPIVSVSDTTSRNTRMAPSLCSSSLENPLHLGNLPQTKRCRTNKHSDMSKQSETQRNAGDYGSLSSNYFRMNTGSHEGEVSLALSLQAKK
ncbi:BEL1-like homeodomain protein 9 [Rosa rugosa]|uniref:BEL1-like homeodomain protein 9 n=1 Tax=Rosa rugosa TaxID=74645 RepID=UPI002B40BFA2|nr:BEL1-like homeodomain protein 9 [Rosa rugosa]